MQNQSKVKWLPGFAVSESLLVFLKAQASAFIGGACDYAIMISLTTYAHIFYGYSILISGSIGAVINFSINRYWTFKTNDENALGQLQKFVLMAGASVVLKSSGTYLLTEIFKLDYRLSRLCIDALITFGFNFTLQKYWVFKSKELKDIH